MTTVVGRDRELEALAALLDFEQPRILVLDGEAGMGKTTLWRAGVEDARQRGLRVLSCGASGAETQLALTGIRDLLSDAFETVADRLPDPQRHALRVALLQEDPTERVPDSGAVAVAFLNAIRLLAEDIPTLIAVDDVQWLDAASAALLHYVVRRLEDEQVAVLLSERTGDRDALDLARLDPARLRTLEVGLLSVGALGRILSERLDVTYPRPLLHRIHEVSGGNAFYALELARALRDSPRPSRPGDPLPVPLNLLQLVTTRLQSLPAPTFDALAFAAALSRPTLEVIGDALGTDAAPLLEPAVSANVAEVDGGSVRFAHPLFAAAVSEITSARQRTLHARLAEVVADEEERARHLGLAATPPDTYVASTLESAASRAVHRGAPASAAALMEEALRFSPTEASGDSSRRAADAGWYWFVAGDARRAHELLETALASAPAGDERMRALNRLGRFHFQAGSRRTAIALFEEALQTPTRNAALRAEIHEGLAWAILLLREDIPRAVEHAKQAVQLATDAQLLAPLSDALVVQAQGEFLMGHGLPSPAIQRALSVQTDASEIRVLRRPQQHLALILTWADQFDEGRALMLGVRQLANSVGDETALTWILMRLSQLELAAGQWDLAREYADEAHDIAREAGQRPLEADLLCTRALLAAHRGDTELARTFGNDGLEAAEALETGLGTRLARSALGLLELSLDEVEASCAQLEPLWAASAKAQIVDPGDNRYVPDLIEALVKSDRVDEAASIQQLFEERARKLQRTSAIGTSARSKALVLAARGDADGALTQLRAAAGIHASAPVPFERARTLLALGSELRRQRQRRAARDALAEAHGIFAGLGASLYQAKTEQEIGRIGGRAPSGGELTPTEQRIAELVAEGKKNKEVAETLVVSVHTIEAALTRIYQKLDVRSRTELVARLSKL
jgi:DNA-binding NarL/FixJ family response regulator